MPLRALLLDLDGTLVDTNDTHTDAWMLAFEEGGYDVAREAVARAIGMGGDKLVAHLLGDGAEAEHGDALRGRSGEHFAHLAKQRGFRFFDGAEALLEAARERGLATAICTSASKDDLDVIFDHAPADLRERTDLVTSASDVDDSKPDPDVLQAALGNLGLGAAEAVFVGDTVYDGEAAKRTGVAFLGVATWVWTEGDLRHAGARSVYAAPAAVADDLDALG